MRLGATKSSATSSYNGLGNQLWDLGGARPSLDLNFAGNKNLSDSISTKNLITFTRASSGTYVDSQGVIRTATTNEPRFDHNPTTGESLGLLVEEQRTNLLQRSQEFQGSGWVRGGLTVTADQEIAPDGTQTADTCTLTSSGHALYTFVSVAQSTTYTFSFYAKRGTGTTATYAITNDSAGGASIVANTSYYSQTSSSAWTRIVVTFTTPVGCTSIGAFLQRDSGSSSGTMFFWGAQLEAGAFPTSYIPTTTATVTRSADVASITGSNFSSWYNQTEGTVFASSSLPTPLRSTRFSGSLSINDGTTNNRIVAVINSDSSNNFIGVFAANNNVIQANANTSISDSQLLFRHTVGYALDNYAYTVNGASAVIDTSATVPSVNCISIGVGLSTLCGHIRRLTYWPSRLPNATLQQITR